MALQIKRTVDNGPPSALAEGQLSVEMEPGVLWVGVPTSVDPSGRKRLNPPGQDAAVSVGTTTTVGPGNNANVTQAGTPQNRILNFQIPRGDTGLPSTVPGPPGPSQISQTTPVTAGAAAPGQYLGVAPGGTVIGFNAPAGGGTMNPTAAFLPVRTADTFANSVISQQPPATPTQVRFDTRDININGTPATGLSWTSQLLFRGAAVLSGSRNQSTSGTWQYDSQNTNLLHPSGNAFWSSQYSYQYENEFGHQNEYHYIYSYTADGNDWIRAEKNYEYDGDAGTTNNDSSDTSFMHFGNNLLYCHTNHAGQTYADMQLYSGRGTIVLRSLFHQMAGEPTTRAEYTTLYDARGAEQISILPNKTINFRGNALKGVPMGTRFDDVATLQNIDWAHGYGLSKGELFPARIVANRQAMTDFLDSFRGPVTESFEGGRIGYPVVANFIEQGTTGNPVAGTGDGFTAVASNARTGNFSLGSMNQGRHSTRAVIIFDMDIATDPTISFWWFISSEMSYDFMQVLLRNITDNVTLVDQLTANLGDRPQRTWNQWSHAVEVGKRHHLTLRYRKDGSVNRDDDTLWIDDIHGGIGAIPQEDQAFVFPENGGYVHAYYRSGGATYETRLTRGQSFRDSTTLQLKVFDGAALIDM